MQNNRNNDNIIQYDNDNNYSLSIHKKNNGEQQKKYNKIKWRIDNICLWHLTVQGSMLILCDMIVFHVSSRL
jgi:hypothetical protein